MEDHNGKSIDLFIANSNIFLAKTILNSNIFDFVTLKLARLTTLFGYRLYILYDLLSEVAMSTHMERM